MAQTRFYATERRLQGNHRQRKEHYQFIQEYINLEHMKEDTAEVQAHELEVFLPHHCVIKTDSETTRLRVFDGFARGTRGLSLNNALLVGLTVQDDIFNHCMVQNSPICLHRGHRENVSANKNNEVTKPTYKKYYGETARTNLRTFKLQTITYGTSSASYSATRTLAQIAQDDGIKFPLATEVINKNLYRDDVLTGVDTLTETLELRNQLIQLCNGGKFKWCANHTALLNNLPPEDLGEIHKYTHEGNNGLTKYWQHIGNPAMMSYISPCDYSIAPILGPNLAWYLKGRPTTITRVALG